MATPPVALEELTADQIEYVRKRLTSWAELDPAERATWLDETARDVWLLENREYNWTMLGEPDPEDDRYNFMWTWTVSNEVFLHRRDL